MYRHTKHIKADRPRRCDRCGGLIQQGDPIHEELTIEGDVMTTRIMHDAEHIECEEPLRIDHETRTKDLKLTVDRLMVDLDRAHAAEATARSNAAQLDHDRLMALELAHQSREEAREAQALIDQIWAVVNPPSRLPRGAHGMVQAIRALLEDKR